MPVLSLYSGWNPMRLIRDLLMAQLNLDLVSLSNTIEAIKRPDVEDILAEILPKQGCAEDPVEELTHLAKAVSDAFEFTVDFHTSQKNELQTRINQTLKVLKSVATRDDGSVRQFLQQEIAYEEERLPMNRTVATVVLKTEERRRKRKRTCSQREQLITGRIDFMKLLLQLLDAYYPT